MGQLASDAVTQKARPILETIELSKSFGATAAVRGMTFDVHAGEIHGLVGENGAGKSTFINMLGGNIAPDSGSIRLGDDEFQSLNPRLAKRLGISVVYQEPALCGNLTAAENIYLSEIPSRFGFLIDRTAIRNGASKALVQLGAESQINAPVEQMRTAERQLTEIARTIVHHVRVLILDEPTSSLTHEDFEALKRILLNLKSIGVGIIFISHRLPEVLDLAQRITVMRDGRLVKTLQARDTSATELASLMVGSSQMQRTAQVKATSQSNRQSQVPALEISNASRRGKFEGVSLKVWPGEIVGIAGLRGAGRAELLDCVYGLDQLDSGLIRINGEHLARGSPATARRRGVGYVPQDRKTQGVIDIWDLKHNLAVGNLHAVSRWGVLRSSRLNKWSRNILRMMGVTPENPGAPIKSLSGGNQQKVVFGKAIAGEPRLLLLLEPTRGIDVRAKVEIGNKIQRVVSEGAAALVIDSELSELLALCSRIYVMHRGRVMGELDVASTTEEEVTLLSAGGRVITELDVASTTEDALLSAGRNRSSDSIPPGE